MAEEHSIFRKQSMDSINSPEQLSDYIASAKPSVWLMLAAVLLLLIGAGVWCIFGRLETTITTGAYCSDGVLTVYIPEDTVTLPEPGAAVKVEGRSFTISQISRTPALVDGTDDPYTIHISSLAEGDFAYRASAPADLSDGAYKAVITVDSISPISFLTNG